MPASHAINHHRTLTWITVAATLGALLAVPFAAEASAAATPKCFGKKATIVGTNGRDVLKGTPGADVIVAKGGNDVISGGGGKDRICAGGGDDKVGAGVGADWVNGGAGNDTLGGYKGEDKLFGMRGQDTLIGGPGKDRLNGGLDTDRCFQNAGVGTTANCETADLSVVVDGPAKSKSGDVTFTITVKNLGPDAVTYSLDLQQSSQKATCADPDWAGAHAGAVLSADSSRTMQVTTACTKEANGAKVRVAAAVSSFALDPDGLNNTAEDKTNLK